MFCHIWTLQGARLKLCVPRPTPISRRPFAGKTPSSLSPGGPRTSALPRRKFSTQLTTSHRSVPLVGAVPFLHPMLALPSTMAACPTAQIRPKRRLPSSFEYHIGWLDWSLDQRGPLWSGSSRAPVHTSSLRHVTWSHTLKCVVLQRMWSRRERRSRATSFCAREVQPIRLVPQVDWCTVPSLLAEERVEWGMGMVQQNASCVGQCLCLKLPVSFCQEAWCPVAAPRLLCRRILAERWSIAPRLSPVLCFRLAPVPSQPTRTMTFFTLFQCLLRPWPSTRCLILEATSCNTTLQPPPQLQLPPTGMALGVPSRPPLSRMDRGAPSPTTARPVLSLLVLQARGGQAEESSVLSHLVQQDHGAQTHPRDWPWRLQGRFQVVGCLPCKEDIPSFQGQVLCSSFARWTARIHSPPSSLPGFAVAVSRMKLIPFSFLVAIRQRVSIVPAGCPHTVLFVHTATPRLTPLLSSSLPEPREGKGRDRCAVWNWTTFDKTIYFPKTKMSTFLTCFHLNQTSFTEQSGNFTHTCNTATTTFRSRNPSIISTIFPPPSPPS